MKSQDIRSLLIGTAMALVMAASTKGLSAESDTLPPQHWIETPRPAQNAPNVLVIMTDDVGFGASSTFGGPVTTPTFDELAANGLRFNRFHTTAICSATRAALLTGRNHNAVGMGSVSDLPVGYDGYNSIIPASAKALPDLLRRAGYNTACFGKWHLTPRWEQGPTGPFEHWPTGMGCEKFFGFIQGDTNQWAPALYDGTNPVDPPYNDPTYILDRDLADHAVNWLRTQKSSASPRPFFLYYATGTPHAPHHAPKEWIDRFKGKFDGGWDVLRQQILDRQIKLGVVPKGTKLPPLPQGAAAWNTLSADQKRLYAREMEVYAGTLAHADYQIGRIIAELKADSRFDNTLIFYIQGDNGASTEGGQNGSLNEVAAYNQLEPTNVKDLVAHIDELGGPLTLNHYAKDWALALDTPYRWTKLIGSHFGGTRNGMVVSWPARIKNKGGLRTQFSHVIDVVPTVLEAAGVTPPAVIDGVAQQPFDGTSMLYAFNDARAPERHSTQYFSMMGNLAIYKDGWVAATTPDAPPWDFPLGKPMLPLDQRKWELYDTRKDANELNDLAAAQPEKLKALQAVFWSEAERNKALPIFRNSFSPNMPNALGDQKIFVYASGVRRLPAGNAPNTLGRSFTISADVIASKTGNNGVIITQGGRFGGYGLFMRKGKVIFTYNLANLKRTELRTDAPLKEGKHTIQVSFDYDGGGPGKGGTLHLIIDGAEMSNARLDQTTKYIYTLDETFDVGSDSGTPVSEDYKLPFDFDGELQSVRVNLK